MSMISVIMPVFNGADYLEESIESIRNQTFSDIEIICIDDGSVDKTNEILNKHMREDQRIRLYTNPNRMGAAKSRNIGIKKAEGEFLIFLDADDLFEADMLELAYNAIIRHNADYTEFNYTHFSGKLMPDVKEKKRTEADIKKYCSGGFSIRQYPTIDCLRWGVSTSDRLYRNSFIKGNNLEFQDLPSANDVYFACMAMFLAENIILVETGRDLLHARDHRNPNRISYQRDPMCVYQAMQMVQEQLIVRGAWMENFGYYYAITFRHLYSALNKCDGEIQDEFYRFLQKRGVDYLIQAGEGVFELVEPYIFTRYQKLKEKPKEWMQKELGLKMYLDYYKVKADEIFSKAIEEGKKIAIWGMGENGLTIMHFCEENNYKISAFIDSDKKKQGSVIGGNLIKKIDEAYQTVDIIIIASSKYYPQIETEVRKLTSHIELVDILEQMRN